jgi:hypothetical protein
MVLRYNFLIIVTMGFKGFPTKNINQMKTINKFEILFEKGEIWIVEGKRHWL